MGSSSTLHDLASRSFLVLEPAWTVGRALNLVATLEPEYVLLSDGQALGDRSPTFHGARALDLELRLAREDEELRLEQVDDLSRYLDRLPACDAYLPIHEAPDLCLVVDEDDVIGVWDADDSLGPWRSGGDGAHRLEVEHEPEVDLGAETSLLVFLETDEFVGSDALPLDVPVGSEIEIWARARRGFAVEGPRSRRLRVEKPPEDDFEAPSPSPAVFKLRATEIGVGRVEIHALCQAEHLGRLVLAPRVRDPDATPENDAGSSSFRFRSASDLRLRQRSQNRPDLTLTILETHVASRTELEFRLHGKSFEDESFGPFPVTEDPYPHLGRLYGDLQEIQGVKSPSGIHRRLRQTGAYLFHLLFPEPLQRRLWEERGNLTTVQVLSDEVVLPWELCVLCGPEDGEIVEAGHFCELFDLTRWWSGSRPASELSLCTMGVVAPPDADLPGAEQEAQFLLDRGTPNCPVERLPDSYEELIQALQQGRYGALHFTGHGFAVAEDGDWASINLRGKERLCPHDLTGIASNLGRTRPLVFLNACRTGYGGNALQGTGGWATRFLHVGAGAFVGTLWSVRTRAARCFAEVFYEALFHGETIGHAARKARCTVRDEFPEKTTWLAYTVFADPLARWKSGGAGSEEIPLRSEGEVAQLAQASQGSYNSERGRPGRGDSS